MPNDTPSLGSMLERIALHESDGDTDMPGLSMVLLCNYTVEPLLPYLRYLSYEAGLRPEITVGGYDTIQQEALDPGSVVYATSPDLVVVSWILEHLDPGSKTSDWDPTAATEAVVGTLRTLVDRSEARVAVTTLLSPLHFERDLLAPSDPNHRTRRVERLNDEIRALAAESGGRLVVLDVARIVERVGEADAIDYRFWYMNRAPFGRKLLSRLARDVIRIGRTVKGKLRKCLVLDCDNTLWGGVIGEDGLTGIQLDPHEYPGRCFHDFQQSVLNLADQGIILALCSKNNEADAWEVFDNHPHSLIRRSHIAAHRINWEPKPQNLLALAEELNIGVDSFVFVDDSGVECEMVRQTLPEVAVLQAPSTPYDLPRLVYEAGVFDTLSVSAEDGKRTELYRAERERKETASTFGSIEDFLGSLSLRAVIHAATEPELARVTQLLGKTNQFNLTTRRHDEGAVSGFHADPDARVFTMAAGDRFGDLGIIAVCIARKDGEEAHIDTLLMSCRALGRKLERLFLRECMDRCEADWGIGRWTAEYIPTRKNALVAGFWQEEGFEVVAEGEDRTLYSIDPEDRVRPELDYIELVEAL